MDHEQILKVIEECAAELSPNKLEGVKKLEERFKEDPDTHKAILGLIALNFSEHADFITDYLQVGFSLTNREPKQEFEEHLKYYPSLQKLVRSKLGLVGLQLDQRNYPDAQKSIAELIGYFEDLGHDISVGTSINQSPALRKGKLFDEINTFQKRLNRLSDFIVISDQDKILKEMAVIQSSMKTLAASMHQHIKENF